VETDTLPEAKQLPLFNPTPPRRIPVFFGISFFVPESNVKSPGRRVWQHHLTPCVKEMVIESGLQEVTWGLYERDGWGRPEKLVPTLEKALNELKSHPDRFIPLQKDIGIASTYKGLIGFVESYLQACRDYPEARIGISI
jgi:hypothetical protein